MARSGMPATARGARTRQRLLDAAEAEFGETGFHQASISNITQRAGVAQGTFYIYFESKEDILRHLVEHMSRQMRHSQSVATENAADRLHAEKRGLEHFLEFALEHDNLYRIMMQSQFVDEALHRSYYDRLLRGYERRLEEAQARGEIHQGDPGALATALVGIAYMMGLRFTSWERRMPDADTIDTVLGFIGRGLAPDTRASCDPLETGSSPGGGGATAGRYRR